MTDRTKSTTTLLVLGLALGLASARGAAGAERQCLPCGGVVSDEPGALIPLLASPPALQKKDVLYLAWPVPLAGESDIENATVARNAASKGFTPWLKLEFSAAPPLKGSTALEAEIARVASIAHHAPAGTHFELDWGHGSLSAEEVSDYAYLLKRAAVAISGAGDEDKVVTEPLPADTALLSALYSNDVAAYVDMIALAPDTASNERSALAKLTELDPGKPVALDALPFPPAPDGVLSAAARSATAGFAVTLFAAPPLESAALAPLKVLAREFAGDLSPDPDSAPSGPEGTETWAFVRGKDLGLRVVVASRERPAQLELEFDDPQLRRPTRVDLTSGADTSVFDFQPRH
ncbi:MAG TPA: hypothetical protein VKA53_05010, partial [Thermoanaerobaculia bacterium]|nr:hypothetical protein [Thermoanaerobaculia bacterium]